MKIKERKYRKQIQLLMFLLFPLVIIGGYFYPYLGFIVVGMICLFLIIAPFKGRFFCGWLCPMGAYYERVLSLLSLKKKVPPIFRKKWFRWLVFVVMMSLLTLKLIYAGSDPAKIGNAFRFMWIISGSIATVLGIIFIPRLWCRICPMGTMQGAISQRSYLLKISDECNECKLCQKVCPISSAPFEHKETGFLMSEECMKCFNCVDNCPKKALKVS